MKIIFLIIISIISFTSGTFAQIFSQDFSAGGVTADYVNVSPTGNQWNSISSTGAGVTVTIISNALVFTRGSANTGSFSRTTDFSPPPTAMVYKFDISVSGNSTATTSVATIQIGSSFTTVNSAESNVNTYARLNINYTATNGTFQIRDITNGVNSADLTGTQNITWVLNNTGLSTTYSAPDASTESIANDKADVWAGTTKIFDDVAIQTTTQIMTDIKFVISNGTGSITFDNFQIFGSTDGTLPVELKSFKAIKKSMGVELVWETATEVNNAGFDIESRNIPLSHFSSIGTLQGGDKGSGWTKIGYVEGHGTTFAPHLYTYNDANAKGRVLYRLKQIDRDGKFEYSKTEEIEVGLKTEDFKLNQNYPNPFNPNTIITFTMKNAEHVNVTVYNSLGQAVETLFNSIANPNELYSLNFDGKNLSSGTYFYALRSASRNEVRKMLLTK